jgi:PAH dioxygenase small subunit
LNAEVLSEVSRFLVREAALLDSGQLDAWLEIMDPDVRYLMPVRSVRYGSADSEFSATSFHLNETLYTLKMRVARLHTKYAWSEDPPTHYRHFVSNIDVGTTTGDVTAVESNVLLYRGRSGEAAADFMTAKRCDELKRCPEGLRLLKRQVLTDQTVWPISALTTFL